MTARPRFHTLARVRCGALAGALFIIPTAAVAQAPDAGGASLSPEQTRTPPGVAVDRPHLTPAQEARYQEGLRAYQDRRYQEAIDIYSRLAHDNPRDGVLGMVVASYASLPPTPELADRLAAEADEEPGDTFKQFVAGVVSHYAAHHSGRTREEKVRLYEQALRVLPRCLPAYDFEPRLFIYLAISHFRLGHQRDAEAFIERAVPLGRNDPDVFYCRAEIFQRTNTARAVEDIDRYIRMISANEARGAVGDPGKTARVRAMREHLVRMQRGEEQHRELWDPIQEHGGAQGNEATTRTDDRGTPTRGSLRARRDPGRPWRYGIMALAAVLAAVLVVARPERWKGWPG